MKNIIFDNIKKILNFNNLKTYLDFNIYFLILITGLFFLSNFIIREVNNYKTVWCFEKICEEIIQFENNNNKYKPKIAVCGLAYKPHIDDLRESSALYIAKKIKEFHPVDLTYFIEPNIDNHMDFEISRFDEIKDIVDISFILVAHDEFKEIEINKSKRLVNFL